MLGLYLHIPFCSSICNYCNFNRGLLDQSLAERYVAALEQEVLRSGAGEAADTVYFGGGTPSLLQPAEIGRLIAACRRAFALDGDAEVTLETNPETAAFERLVGFREAGITRISFGVQSFRDAELRRLGRVHSSARAVEAVADARRAGFDNISVDLMMWLPGQSRDEWKESVEALVSVGADHASLYLLELYPNAPLKEEMARAGWSLAPDEDAASMYTWSMERLEAAAYGQYEISNVARNGRESRHNLKYWTDGAWLGLGCGAHSTRDGVRWKNVSGTEDYIGLVAAGRPAGSDRRVLTPAERLEEALFTGLRLTEGVDIEAVGARYGVEVWSRFGRELQPFVDEGLLERRGPRLRLTRTGMLIANEIMAVFV
ncbi:MAG TPA: radical SAM family heme chaperone HemW [Vicinamibacterales bacterium]|nr:radical SAM family heme chaperone HemW [Vicinamibacterales bacterium]